MNETGNNAQHMEDSGHLSVSLLVNGETHVLEVQPDETLADVLREKLGLTGTKIMCDEGACGSCTVLSNGKPILSCLALAVDYYGKKLLTIEGLADSCTENLHPLQEAFIEYSGMQCGTCTPAMILTAKELLDRNSDPTANEVREALSGNLCRCGNYNRITECVLAAAEGMKA